MAVFIVSIAVSIVFRSNAITLIINLFFTFLMFVILMISMRHITRFSQLVSAIKKGTVYIKSLTDAKKLEINDVFPSSIKLTNLLRAYYKENSGFDGDIVDYINESILEEEIHKQTTELAVSAMTGLGLLGTFVGLILGIKDLDIEQEQLMESIKTLMNGMKTAFLTSIFGVSYSLIFNTIYKKQYSDGIKVLDEFHEAFYDKIASNPETRNMNRLLEYQGKMVEGIEQLPTTISTAIAVEFDKVVAPTISKLEQLMEQFVSVATTKQQESLDILVHSFIDSMNNILNDKFVMLAETLDKTCEMQTKNYEMMNHVVAATTVQLQHFSALNESVNTALENIKMYATMIENYNDSISEHNSETHKLIATVLESQNSTYTAIQDLTKNIADATSFVSTVKEVVAEMNCQMEAFSKQIVEIMNINASTIEKANQGTVEIIDRYCTETTNVVDAFGEHVNASLENFSKQTVEIMNANASTIEKANQDTAEIIDRYCTETSNVADALGKQINTFTVISENLITEIKTVGSRIHTECNGLESSLSTSLNGTFKVFDENLAEITTHLNSSLKEMQELVDRLPRDLYISIGKLKESMDQCVMRLNDSNAPKEGKQ